jgi:gamma-glutamylcyclotransferase (GGCT)/AIG2-like uncharacterized protein YtfP
MAQISDSLDDLIISKVNAEEEAAAAADDDESSSYHMVFIYGSLLSGSHDLFHNHKEYLMNHHQEASSASSSSSSAIFIGYGKTEKSNFIMFSQVYSSYPYVVDKNKLCSKLTSKNDDDDDCMKNSTTIDIHPSQILGEVWKVNDDVLAKLDSLEGHPKHYCREPVNIILDDDEDNLLLRKTSSSSSFSSSPYSSPSKSSSITMSSSLNDLRNYSSPMNTNTNNHHHHNDDGDNDDGDYSKVRKSGVRSERGVTLRRSVSLSPPSSIASSIHKNNPLTPTNTKKRCILTQMYLLSNEDKIINFAFKLKEQHDKKEEEERRRRRMIDQNANQMDGDTIISTPSIEPSYDHIHEVVPYGDWRTFRTRTFESETG